MDCLRVFVAGTADITVVVPAPGVEEAYDILVAGGVVPQKAADLAVAFARHRDEGKHPAWRAEEEKDPVFQARKFLRLRQAVLH